MSPATSVVSASIRRSADLSSSGTTIPTHAFPCQIPRGDQEPENWLTYSRTVLGQRFSPLTQITPANVRNLELAWLWQAQSIQPKFEATALAVDGVTGFSTTPLRFAIVLAAIGMGLAAGIVLYALVGFLT